MNDTKGTKKERHRLTDQQRVDIIRAVERDPTLKNVELGRRYNITEAAIRQLLQKKEVILERYLKSNPNAMEERAMEELTANMTTTPSVPATGGGRGGRKGKLRLNDKQRIDIIRAVERDPTIKKVELGRRYNITEAAIRQLLQKKDKILERVAGASLPAGPLPGPALNRNERKKTNAPSHMEIPSSFDSELYGWITALQSRNVIVPPSLIQRKAKELSEKYPNSDYKPSVAWYNKFCARYNIPPHPTSNTVPTYVNVNNIDLQMQMKTLREKILQYSPERIYNMCETNLFYQLVPSYNVLCPFESAEVTQRKMERVTLVVCTNATGTHKIPILMIGKEKTPISAGYKSLPIHYASQVKAWMDSTIFNHWCQNVFIPEVKLRTSEPVLLLLEHGAQSMEFTIDQVTSMFVPMNMGSRFQPMNLGIIDTLKKEFKFSIFSDLIAILALSDQKRLELEQKARMVVPKGAAGIQYGRSPHIFDAMVTIKAAWESLSRETIQNSWALSTLVPGLDRISEHKECHIVHDMCAMLSCISLNSTYGEISTEIVEWMAIDDNESHVLREEIQRDIDELLHAPTLRLDSPTSAIIDPPTPTPWIGDEPFVQMVMAVEDQLGHPRIQTILGDQQVQSTVQALRAVVRQLRRDTLLRKAGRTVEL